jgi:NAD(P)-dependent dehydrogenase (short-subunit alcohol dehydrogenase family)
MTGTALASRNKVAVVTGGTMGIGRATAQAFAREGWSVAVLARGEERLRSTEAELKALGARVLAIRVDMADAEAVNAAADRIERELGPIEAWVNNAMVTVVAPARDISPEEFRRVTDVTYHGLVFGTLAALRHMRPRNRGAIVQISSGIGVRAAPLQSAYCAAKAAAQAFTDSLRTELLHDRTEVSLTVLYLPAVNTPQFRHTRNHTGHAQQPPDPVFDPRLCANAVLSAVRDPQREIWVGRSTLEMVAAQALAPGLADRYAARMWEAQLEAGPPPNPAGNLFDPGTHDPGVDGPFTDRVKPARHEFVTSRARKLATLGVTALGILGVTALAAPVVAAIRPSRDNPHR